MCVWGGGGGGSDCPKDLYLNRDTNGPLHILFVQRMAHHNHLINLNYPDLSFVNL